MHRLWTGEGPGDALVRAESGQTQPHHKATALQSAPCAPPPPEGGPPLPLPHNSCGGPPPAATAGLRRPDPPTQSPVGRGAAAQQHLVICTGAPWRPSIPRSAALPLLPLLTAVGGCDQTRAWGSGARHTIRWIPMNTPEASFYVTLVATQ